MARYGRGNFRWVTMVGDLSAMYDEIDPALACEMAQEAIQRTGVDKISAIRFWGGVGGYRLLWVRTSRSFP